MSVFLDDITAKANVAKKNSMEEKEAYQRIVKKNNIVLTSLTIILGAIAFGIMSYCLQKDISQFEFYFSSIFAFIAMLILTNIILWVLRGFVVYSVWNGFIRKEQDKNIALPFYSLLGISDVSFILFCPIFLIMRFFNFDLGVFVLGLSLFVKYYLEMISYDDIYNFSNSEKCLLFVASFFPMILIRFIFKIFLGF